MEAGQSDSGNAGARPGAACAVLGCDCLQRALHAAGMAERTSHVSSPRAAPLPPKGRYLHASRNQRWSGTWPRSQGQGRSGFL